jgi:hypothetical protein
MNVETGDEAALFPKKEYMIKGIFVAVWVSFFATRLPQTRHLWFYIPWASDRTKTNSSFSTNI